MEGNAHKYVAKGGSRDSSCRRAPHGARGLKQRWFSLHHPPGCRAPHGARGLKQKQQATEQEVKCRAPHGARGLKLVCIGCREHMPGRAPHGARGLKQLEDTHSRLVAESRPTRGAWIETLRRCHETLHKGVAPHTGRVD